MSAGKQKQNWRDAKIFLSVYRKCTFSQQNFFYFKSRTFRLFGAIFTFFVSEPHCVAPRFFDLDDFRLLEAPFSKKELPMKFFGTLKEWFFPELITGNGTLMPAYLDGNYSSSNQVFPTISGLHLKSILLVRARPFT